MSGQPNFEFRWLSPPGISVVLFMGYGALNTLIGVAIPGLSRRLGTNGLPQHRVDMHSTLYCASRIFQLGAVWFGLRNGHTWALWIVAITDLAQLAGWVCYGIQTRD